MIQKKILVFSYKMPFPLSQGGAIAQFFFLEPMTILYEVTFCTIVNNKSQKDNLDELQKLIPNLNIKYYQKLEEKKTTIDELCKFVKKIEKKINSIFFKKTKAKINSFEETSLKLTNESFFVFFNELINSEKYDLIQFDFYESLTLLPIVPEKTKTILIHHEIRSKRNKLFNNKNNLFSNYLIQSNEIIENAFLSKANSIVVFNEEDKQYLKNINPSIHVSPFAIPDELIQKKNTSKTFNKFIFIGGEFHSPNKEGLEWFLDTIYLPNSEIIKWPLYIIGYWSPNFIKKYHLNKNIIFSGFVSNLNEFYEESIMIVPILSGSGIRTKVLLALANKIPVFSTEFASEGLLLNIEITNHISIFNNKSEFLEIFLNLTNDNLLTTLSNNGFDYYKKYFDNNKLISSRLKILEMVLNKT